MVPQQLLLTRDGARQHVVVPRQVLGGRVDHQVSPQGNGLQAGNAAGGWLVGAAA